jgi:septal ring factor EnvC (AmiA/AmiB activator)
MDPRSPATARDLEQQLQLGRQIFAEANSSRQTLAEIRSVQKQLSELEPKLDSHHAQLKSAASQLQAEIRKILAGSEDPASKIEGLENSSGGLTSALAVVESSDRPVPSQAIALYHESSEALKQRVADWNHVKTNWLPQLNLHLREGNLAPIVISGMAELSENADTD